VLGRQAEKLNGHLPHTAVFDILHLLLEGKQQGLRGRVGGMVESGKKVCSMTALALILGDPEWLQGIWTFARPLCD